VAQSWGIARIEQAAAVAALSPPAVATAPGNAAASGTKQVPRQAPDTAPTELQKIIDTVNANWLSAGKSLRLSVDTPSGHSIVVVRDTQTGAVVQQIPSEGLLRMASTLGTDSHLLLDLTA
jgi:uncharacterized FlaG/YvyC family protein